MESASVRVSLFGLGYVGAITAACLAAAGHRVIGVDPEPTKRRFIDEGRSPVHEAGADELIAENVAAGRLTTTSDPAWAIRESDVSFICVGTPSGTTGRPDYSYLIRVCEQIGGALATIDHPHTVNIRSTILPRTMAELVRPLLEQASGKVAGRDFGLTHNPEFLRQGSAIADYYDPPKIVIGELAPGSGDIVARLYAGLTAPMIRTSLEVAEMVKITDNTWHALKITFANEIGTLCKEAGVDGHAVMDAFCQDTKLNISPRYLKPGYGFGGSCLPKDTQALVSLARRHDVALPMIARIMPSNAQHVARGVDLVLAQKKRKIVVLGCSFKFGTDDLRGSPLVELIEQLIGKGADVRVYDRDVRLASLIGANRMFILERIPHIARLMVETLDEALAFGEVIIIGNGDPEFRAIGPRLRDDQIIVDLVRVPELEQREGYHGICW